jgi:PKD repeat protein
MSASAPVVANGSFVAADSVATLILKAGSVSSGDAGVRFDDIEVEIDGVPPANRAPTAVATADPSAGAAPLSVDFDGSGSSDPDGDPLTFGWEFGDGTRGAGARATHVYDAVGDYTTFLTVEDGRGGSDKVSLAVTVNAAPPPAGDPVENGGFETSAGSAGAAAGWTFFSSPGYVATLDVVGDPVHGGTRSQAVRAPQPTVNDRFAGVYQVTSTTPGTTYTVSAWNRTHFPGGHAWDHIARLGIDLSGGTDFAAPSVEWYEFDSRKDAWHRLELDVTASGSQVTLFFQSWRKWAAGGASVAWFDDVEMMGGGTQPPPHGGVPLAVATAQPLTGPAPLTVVFDGSGSSDPDGDPLTYSWDFGDGSFNSGPQPTHTYDLPGSYQARLTVDDSKDGSDTATLPINVTRPTVVLPDYCPAALDFAAIRDQLAQQGKRMATVKIGFHVGPGGNANGLGEPSQHGQRLGLRRSRLQRAAGRGSSASLATPHRGIPTRARAIQALDLARVDQRGRQEPLRMVGRVRLPYGADRLTGRFQLVRVRLVVGRAGARALDRSADAAVPAAGGRASRSHRRRAARVQLRARQPRPTVPAPGGPLPIAVRCS